MTDETEFWLQVQVWIRECEDYERRRAAFDHSPDGIAEINRIISKLSAAPDVSSYGKVRL